MQHVATPNTTGFESSDFVQDYVVICRYRVESDRWWIGGEQGAPVGLC